MRDFFAWLAFVLFFTVPVIVLVVVWTANQRLRYDRCVAATGSTSYCTVAHPWGAHR